MIASSDSIPSNPVLVLHVERRSPWAALCIRICSWMTGGPSLAVFSSDGQACLLTATTARNQLKIARFFLTFARRCISARYAAKSAWP